MNALFNGPPLSTQQIMHPELYFDHPTPALTVKLAGYEKVLHDWKKVDEDTLGELMLKIMIERTMGEDTPYVEASTKWAGDRIVALQKGKSLTDAVDDRVPQHRRRRQLRATLLGDPRPGVARLHRAEDRPARSGGLRR